MTDTLQINEIFQSIQGESTFAGFPCTFIRLSGCNLRCAWCDTSYAFCNSNTLTINEILSTALQFPNRFSAELTGGEPLMQPNAIPLLQQLTQHYTHTLLETNGTYPLDNVPSEVHKIIDLKPPSSQMPFNAQVLINNLPYITPNDEFKIIIADKIDYEWAKTQIYTYKLNEFCTVNLSAAFGKLEPKTLINDLLKDNLPVRFNLQIHKFIWPPEMRGV